MAVGEIISSDDYKIGLVTTVTASRQKSSATAFGFLTRSPLAIAT